MVYHTIITLPKKNKNCIHTNNTFTYFSANAMHLFVQVKQCNASCVNTGYWKNCFQLFILTLIHTNNQWHVVMHSASRKTIRHTTFSRYYYIITARVVFIQMQKQPSLGIFVSFYQILSKIYNCMNYQELKSIKRFWYIKALSASMS